MSSFILFSQVGMNSKNVFGQPRMIASLREACSPRPIRKSTVLEDLKKLIVMDETEDNLQGDSVCDVFSCTAINNLGQKCGKTVLFC